MSKHKLARLAILPVVLGSMGAACSVPENNVTASEPCPGLVINVREGDRIECDVSPPQEINELLNKRSLRRNRIICEDKGGHLVGRRKCLDLDY